jgi:hypothetical protein
MYCSGCGVKAAGKFCWSCGEPLRQQESNSAEPEDVLAEIIDWSGLVNYQSLIAVPEVRERIARHATLSKKKFSGEEFLEACDKVLGTFTGGVPLTLVAKFTQPISEKLGLKTGKTRCERLVERPGYVIVAVLCSLAQNGQKLGEVTQLADGCTIRAAMPSDIWSLKGDVVVTIRAEGSTTLVEADLTVPGQIYDWGKCKRALDRIFADVAQLAKAA